MSNSYFNFKQFTINQEKSAFKVGTDGVLLGAVTDITGAKKILDIGTGTGLVAIMMAQRSDAEIFAIEPDYESYLQACENAGKCKWADRIIVEHTDLQNFSCNNMKFDLIVINPPYFSDSLKSPDQRKTSARHNDGLTSAEILEGVAKLLEAEGRFQLIMPYVEGNIFIAEAHHYGFYCNSILKIRPLPSSEIRRLILTFTRHRTKTSERFLTIESCKRHDFTEEYITLTRDFYLKF